MGVGHDRRHQVDDRQHGDRPDVADHTHRPLGDEAGRPVLLHGDPERKDAGQQEDHLPN